LGTALILDRLTPLGLVPSHAVPVIPTIPALIMASKSLQLDM
jgi:hypothetical protein